MQRIYEDVKLDIGLVSQALNNNNVTGKYHPLAEHRCALAILSGGAMAKTKTTKIEIYEAKNAAAGSAQVLAGSALITANELVTELTIALDTVLNTESIVINGLTFTAHTDTEDKTIRQFTIGGDNTADALSLANCINDPVYGVPGITAVPNVAVLTLLSTIPGETLVSAVSSDATFTVVTTKAQAYVDLSGLQLTALFTHIAVKVITTANSVVAVVLIRYKSRKAIAQKMGANYPA
ncbi:hypothetical protein ES703_97155 [subsurface metagenome]